MAQTIINNLDTGLVARNAINGNFTELYTYSLRTDVAGQINGLSAKAVPVDADYLLIEDSADSWNKKKVLISSLVITDADAIHDNVAGEINAVAEKVTFVDNDILLIEDSADSYAKKKLKKSNLGIDTTLIEDAAQTTGLYTEETADRLVGHSAGTGTALIFEMFEGTGTPVSVFQIDGGGRILNNGEQTIRHTLSGTPSIYLGVGGDSTGISTGAVFIGESCGIFSSGANLTVAIGYLAAYKLTGDRSTILGQQAGFNTTSGTDNVFIGTKAGYTNITGGFNLYAGADAGYYQLGSNKIIFDTIKRASAAVELTDSPIVVSTHATKASQTGTFNFATTISNDLTGDIFTIDNGSSDLYNFDSAGRSTQTGYHKASGHRQDLQTYTSGTTAITIDNHTCILDGTSATVTLTLPAIAAASDGAIFYFVCLNADNTCTINAQGGDYVGNTGTLTGFTLAVGVSATYQADSASGRWLLIN